jgi:hypothetical protein
MKDDSRHPYTYAADYLRMAATPDIAAECTVSRAQASSIRKAVARAIGMNDGELAVLLSRQYQDDNHQKGQSDAA